MPKIFVVLEKGYESSFEHLAFRQLCNAYGAELIAIPHDYPTVVEGLRETKGRKIFMARPGRIPKSGEFADYVLPDGDVVFCLGSPQETLASYVGDDDALHITTENPVDMMALSVASMVLYVHG